jgi:hypothetical protein
MADFCGFPHLARPLQNPLHDRGKVRIGQVQGDKTMTNTTNLTRNAMASVFALFASWVAISAAIGPVLPTIA